MVNLHLSVNKPSLFPFITVTKILSKINLVTGIGEVVGTDPDRVSEEGVREHDGGG